MFWLRKQVFLVSESLLVSEAGVLAAGKLNVCGAGSKSRVLGGRLV